jgi:hypothetical protein
MLSFRFKKSFKNYFLTEKHIYYLIIHPYWDFYVYFDYYVLKIIFYLEIGLFYSYNHVRRHLQSHHLQNYHRHIVLMHYYYF